MNRLAYAPAATANDAVPAWVDGALKRAVSLNPHKRYDSLSEFLHDLRNPNPAYLRPTPLIERNPLLFWQGLCAVLLTGNIVLLYFATR